MAAWAPALEGLADMALSYRPAASSYRPSPSAALPAITCRMDGSPPESSAILIALRYMDAALSLSPRASALIPPNRTNSAE